MPQTRSYRYSNSYDTREREGACSRDVWKLYYMLPDNTNFHLQFFYADDTRNVLEDISFLKCGNPLEDKKSVSSYEQQMKDAFNRWGHIGFRELIMGWRRGFGNSVLVQVVIYRPMDTIRMNMIRTDRKQFRQLLDRCCELGSYDPHTFAALQLKFDSCYETEKGDKEHE